MTPTVVGLLGLLGLFGLLALKMPVGIAMAVVGTVGFGVLNSWTATMAQLGREPFVIASSYELVVIPLFVLMGNLASISGMSRDLFQAAYAWFGHWRGGLASATIAACAGFAAVSGSSVASAVTMGRVALPEMRRYKYSTRLSTGCIAAGGTLGILIPPSTGFVIYAILTEESIGRLFLAGILPGLLLTALFMAAIYIQCRINPELGPPGPRTPMREKFTALRQAGAMVCIVVITIGGIYVGAFSPTEAAGVGGMGALLMAIARRQLNLERLQDIMRRTLRISSMVFLILIGASIFSLVFRGYGGDDGVRSLLESIPGGVIGAVVAVMLIMFLLGFVLDFIEITFVVVPIVGPVLLAMGLDPVWLGIMIAINLQTSFLTPPFGFALFYLRGVAPSSITTAQIYRGVIPFVAIQLLALLLIAIFPELVTWLPGKIYGS